MKNAMIYHPVAVCDTEDYFHSWENATKKNQEHMNAIEKKAIEQGSLLYRFLYEGVADGVAIYQIVKENCSGEYGGATPQDDIMERLLNARKGK